MSMGDGAPGGHGLDLETARSEGGAAQGALACSGCQSQIAKQYFTAGEAVFCDACRYQYEAELRNQSGLGLFARAGAFGFVAALAGALLWGGVIWFTGYELGLIAIVVGFMVGAAVKIGTRGRGGLLYQFMAVGLTYLAVSLSYVPLVIQGFRQLAEEEMVGFEEGAEFQEGMLPSLEELESEELALAEEPFADFGAEPGSDPVAFEGEGLVAPGSEGDVALGAAGMLIAGLGVLALAAALPFLAGLENIIGIAIIGFALWQAWSMNKKVDLSVSGPYQVGDGA